MADEPWGRFTDVTRIGDEIHRSVKPWSRGVQALLLHLERAGFDGAPRFLGLTEDGRERLSFIPGTSVHDATAEHIPERSLTASGELIRQFHEAARSFDLPDDLALVAEPMTAIPGARIVCHNDLSPRNTVFRDGQPVALIDWALAQFAPPIWDVAHAVWQFVPIIADQDHADAGWPDVPGIAQLLRRMTALLDGYGPDATDRARLADVLALRIEATASGIRALASAGDARFAALVADGTVDGVERARDWAIRHRPRIQRELAATR